MAAKRGGDVERSGPIYNATEGFKVFIETFDARHSPGDPSGLYLQTYLTAWLRNGEGIIETGRNFQTYLRVALNIADATMRRQIDFDYCGTQEENYADRRSRTVEALHEPGDYDSYFADPAQYEQIACEVEFAHREGRPVDSY